jgi:hypothetical protein
MSGLAGIGFVATLGLLRLDSDAIFLILGTLTLLSSFAIMALLRPLSPSS